MRRAISIHNAKFIVRARTVGCQGGCGCVTDLGENRSRRPLPYGRGSVSYRKQASSQNPQEGYAPRGSATLDSNLSVTSYPACRQDCLPHAFYAIAIFNVTACSPG